MVLRTDIRKEERLRHGCRVPFVVARRTHVAAVVARVVIVVVGGAWRHVGVLSKHFSRALVLAVGVGLRQVPRHPVRVLRLLIIRGGVALPRENLFGTVFQRCRLFILYGLLPCESQQEEQAEG